MSMYNPKVLEHYHNPRNIGEIEDADGVGVYLSDFCGDITKFWIKVQGDKIIDVKFKTQGCAASIASGSMLTELAKGKTIEEVLKITKEDVAGSLGGLPEQKIHCSLLATDALCDAIYDYLSKNRLPIPKELSEKHDKIKLELQRLKDMGYILI